MPAIATVRQTETRSRRILRDFLLLAGVLSSVVYITADIVCGLRYPGYSFADQVISELSSSVRPRPISG